MGKGEKQQMLLFFVYERAPLRGCLSLIVSTHYRAARVPAGDLVLALSFGTYIRVIVLPLSFSTLAQAAPATFFLPAIASPFLSWSFQKIACTFFLYLFSYQGLV